MFSKTSLLLYYCGSLYFLCSSSYPIAVDAWMNPSTTLQSSRTRKMPQSLSSSVSSSSLSFTKRGRNMVKTTRPHSSTSFYSLSDDEETNAASSNPDNKSIGDGEGHDNIQNSTDIEPREVRLAKLQSEIDRILSNPVDPPFDMESELKKVIQINPPVNIEVLTNNNDDFINEDSSSSSSSVGEEEIVEAMKRETNENDLNSSLTATTTIALSSSDTTETTSGDTTTIELSSDDIQKSIEDDDNDDNEKKEKNSSKNIDIDVKVSLMEEELYQAVKEQDYMKAQQKSDEISKLHVDDCGAVLQINSAFYKAFSEKDLQSMERIWLQDNGCICVHPSLSPIVGCYDIIQSWKRMFDASDGSFQRTWMEPNNIRLSVKGTTATVTCDEYVYARRFVRGKRRQTELINKLMATNIFRKVGTKWYLTHHHASWHADSENAKIALKGGNSNSNSKDGGLEDDLNGKNKKKRLTRRIIFNRKSDDDDNDNDDDDADGPSIDSILGVKDFGPLLGDDSSNDGEEGSNGPFRKVIMGSLSDLLNGGLLGGPPSEGGGPDSINGLGGSNGDGNSDDGSGLNGAIIQFHRIDDDEESALYDDDDDDEDDDDDDDDDRNDDKISLIKTLKQELNMESSSDDHDDSHKNKKIDNDGNKDEKKNNDTSSSSSSPITSSSSGSKPLQSQQQPAKDSLRQNCIGALRKLANQGCISNKQKQVLLTDIISCSAKGEFSMVEVAYELLCGEEGGGGSSEDYIDVAEEEFADQCRVFAHSFLIQQQQNQLQQHPSIIADPSPFPPQSPPPPLPPATTQQQHHS